VREPERGPVSLERDGELAQRALRRVGRVGPADVAGRDQDAASAKEARTDLDGLESSCATHAETNATNVA
jgi:hypothetical protein